MMVHEVQHMTLKDERQTDAWEQWQWLWNAIFYASVLASYGISVAASNRVVVGTAYALAAGLVGEI